ncbi:peptidoglycan editing factor PgeF [Mangrovicoccus algicola]|uniref:Purine nucleoside phosphorylase n=1 Tax=Mangrovicoccus algicola TaxID=2771008 RepID=A0A8J6YX04_9RHOB|nr:peptidoglycan editing factor PgeF [Mangrovicoccus algicola]MBE3639430.1 peptidoglycan editing factor PgeF [Mangrovicoccus algicola]
MALEIITSDALSPLRHGFFTRKGGASSGIYEGLNCGFGSSDQAQIVRINRARVAGAMGAGAEDMAGVNQVHSAVAATVEAATTPPLPEADAVVTATPGLVLTILTADCAPVLFADAEAGVIGAAHAGWRGALGGVLEATLAAMEAAGARRDRIAAVIGPTISQAAYEVGQDFMERFLDEDMAHQRFFAGGKAPDKYQFDLPGFAAWRLREAGIGHAEWSRHCTYSDPARFFSFRRSFHRGEPDYGRLAAAIRL